MVTEWRRHVWVSLLYLLGWLALDAAAQQFSTAPGVSVWYPPPALDYVLLLVFGVGYWPLLLVSNILHEVLIVESSLPAPLLGVSVGVAVAGHTLACVVLRRWRLDPRLPRLRDVRLFVTMAVFAAPLIVTALQVLCLLWGDLVPGERVGERVLQLWAGTATGVGMLAPPLLLLLRRWPGVWGAGTLPGKEDTPSLREPATPPRPPSPEARWTHRRQLLRAGRRLLDWLAEALVAVVALWIGYGGPRGGTLDFSYVLFVPLLWTATRHTFERTALAVLGLNVGVALLTGGPNIRRTDGLALQFGLLTVTISGLLLGAALRERRRLTERLRRLALHDPLTGLGNRRLFHERVTRALRRPSPAGTLAVLLMDFDDFKAINDSLGHTTGDEVLRAVGERLGAAVPTGRVARLGGDEFAVLLEEVRGPDEAVEEARRLLRVLDEPVVVGDQRLRVGASVGVALWDGGEEDGETLLRDADVALYRAKAGQRGQVQLFDASMHAAVLERVELEAELRASLARGDFELHYQPLVDVASGTACGVEALVRWRHPTRGLLAPGVFLPLAEETGLVVPLGAWVLRTACREVAGWTGAPGAPPPTVGVNLSAAHLARPQLVGEVAQTLRETGLVPSRLMLEITESVLVRDLDTTVGTLRALRDLGVRLAVDDFGTGYSSLSYLRHFPIHDLKVDRSFVTDLGRDPAATELARVIAVLGRTLGLTTVAEGVETAQQYAEVRALGYTLAQGYYIARPLPADQARLLLGRERPLVAPTV